MSAQLLLLGSSIKLRRLPVPDGVPTLLLAENLGIGHKNHTEASIALFNLSKILVPWLIASAEPMKRLPTEQIDNSNSEFFVEG